MEAAVKALSVGSDGSAADSWNIRTVLAQLLETGRTSGPQLARRVRTGLAAVLASHLAVEGVRGQLQISDDLRAPSLAGDRALTGARLAAAACIEFARIELSEVGTNLAARTGAWTSKTLGGWERERLIAVHLVDAAEIAPTDVSWWKAAFAVLARLSAMTYLTPDVGRFVQVAIGTCEPADQADLEAALTEGFGPVPGPEALRAARAELADDDARLARTLASVLSGTEALAELLGEDAADMPELEWESALQPVWRTVYCLSEVAPASVLAPWRPVLDLLAEFTGPPPVLTEPLIKIGPYPDHGESTVADFVTRCKERGVLVGAAELSARTSSQGDYYKRTDLRMLEAAIHADPAAWAADISAVAATLSSFDLRTVYLQTLRTDQQQAGLAEDDGRLLTNACTAAWDLKNQLEAGDGSADPDIDERARWIVAQLLRQVWALGADPGVDEAAAVTWLLAAVRAWTAPASVPDSPYVTASATSGGLALVAFLQWAVRRAADTGRLPAEAVTQLTELVTDGRDDRALAAIGAALTPLRHYALPWYTDHQATLLDLAAPSAPIHTWLRSLHRLGADEFAVLGDLDPGLVMNYLRAGAPEEVFDRFAATLLHSPGTFDSDFLATLITGDGGPAAVSTLLGDIARALPLEDVAGLLSAPARLPALGPGPGPRRWRPRPRTCPRRYRPLRLRRRNRPAPVADPDPAHRRRHPRHQVPRPGRAASRPQCPEPGCPTDPDHAGGRHRRKPRPDGLPGPRRDPSRAGRRRHLRTRDRGPGRPRTGPWPLRQRRGTHHGLVVTTTCGGHRPTAHRRAPGVAALPLAALPHLGPLARPARRHETAPVHLSETQQHGGSGRGRSPRPAR